MCTKETRVAFLPTRLKSGKNLSSNSGTISKLMKKPSLVLLLKPDCSIQLPDGDQIGSPSIRENKLAKE